MPATLIDTLSLVPASGNTGFPERRLGKDTLDA